MTPGERFGECWLDQFDLNDAPPPRKRDVWRTWEK